jgi:hypothetical protein
MMLRSASGDTGRHGEGGGRGGHERRWATVVRWLEDFGRADVEECRRSGRLIWISRERKEARIENG